MNNTVKKLAGDRLVKNFVADEIMAPVAEVVAKAIAHFLSMLPKGAARKYLAAPKSFLGLNIPSAFTSRVASGLGGLGVAELIRLVDPGFDEDNLDYVQDFMMYVAEKYNDLAGAQDPASTSILAPLRGAERIPMPNYRTWYVSLANPLVCVCGDCRVSNAGHHLEIRQVPVGGGRPGQPPRTEPKEFTKVGYKATAFEDIMLSGAHAPADQAEGFEPGCMCVKAFAADKAAFDKAQAAAFTPVAAAQPAKPGKPPSFAKLHGEALTSTDAALRTMAERLRGIIATTPNGLTPEEYVLLECCDSMDEYKALAACTTIAELRSLLPTLRARDERNFLGQGAQEVGFAAAKVWKFAEGVKQRSDTAAAEYKRQRDVLAFCQKQKPCVKREEILAITPGRNSLAELTMDDVRNALIVNRRSGLSPLARHRTQQQPTQPQPAGAANVGRPGWVRRLVRFFV
jgi:hypothetical protein